MLAVSEKKNSKKNHPFPTSASQRLGGRCEIAKLHGNEGRLHDAEVASPIRPAPESTLLTSQPRKRNNRRPVFGIAAEHQPHPDKPFSFLL